MNVATTENGKLDRLATRIRNGIDLRHQSDSEWIQATLDLSAALAEAREHFKDNISFGRWCEESGFDLTHQDRAAYIAFGRDRERTEEILKKTESRSVRLIHQKEFRFTTAGKTRKPKTAAGPSTTPELQKALDAYDAFKAAGIEPTKQQVQERAGIGSTAVRRAFERRLTEAELGRQAPDISEMPKTVKEKVETAVRKIQKRIELEFDQRVQQGIRQHIAEHVLPMYAKKLELADRINAGKKPFTIEEYRQLLGALHPDSSSIERRTEMFRIVKERELLLRPPEKDKPLSSDLPKTIEELLARKKTRR